MSEASPVSQSNHRDKFRRKAEQKEKKIPRKEAFKILVGTERAMPVSLKSDCGVKLFSFKYLDLS